MKGKQRIKLLKSQKILLQKQKNEIIALIQDKQNELSQILSMVMIEQGVPEKDTHLWRLDTNGQGIEKMEPKKPPKGNDKEKK